MADNLSALRRKAAGARLKALMDEKGVSVKELSEALSVTPGAVSQWRQGLSRISQDNLERVAAYLDTTTSYLSTGYADDGGTDLFPLSALEMTLVRSIRENMPSDSYTREEKQLINAVRASSALTTAQFIEIVEWLSNADLNDLLAALSAIKSSVTAKLTLQ